MEPSLLDAPGWDWPGGVTALAGAAGTPVWSVVAGGVASPGAGADASPGDGVEVGGWGVGVVEVGVEGVSEVGVVGLVAAAGSWVVSVVTSVT